MQEERASDTITKFYEKLSKFLIDLDKIEGSIDAQIKKTPILNPTTLTQAIDRALAEIEKFQAAAKAISVTSQDMQDVQENLSEHQSRLTKLRDNEKLRLARETFLESKSYDVQSDLKVLADKKWRESIERLGGHPSHKEADNKTSEQVSKNPSQSLSVFRRFLNLILAPFLFLYETLQSGRRRDSAVNNQPQEIKHSETLSRSSSPEKKNSTLIRPSSSSESKPLLAPQTLFATSPPKEIKTEKEPVASQNITITTSNNFSR